MKQRKRATARRGRPSRAQASAAALKAVIDLGVDVEAIDPRRVLASIAADPSAPASARVQAARALLADAIPSPGAPTAAGDALSKRALALLDRAGGRRN
jgi:hypothetical protein